MSIDFLPLQDSEKKMITNASVAFLQNSLLASGLPYATAYDPEDYASGISAFPDIESLDAISSDDNRDLRRGRILGEWASGEGHNCYLCGIIVQMNVTAPRYWWPEMQRYHFMDIVSSQSTMHSLARIIKQSKMLEGTDTYLPIWDHFTKHTPASIIHTFYEEAKNMFPAQGLPKREDLERIKAMLPEGFLITARITLNYRQLKTIYNQRKDHALENWREMCKWIETLPMHTVIISNKKE